MVNNSSPVRCLSDVQIKSLRMVSIVLINIRNMARQEIENNLRNADDTNPLKTLERIYQLADCIHNSPGMIADFCDEKKETDDDALERFIALELSEAMAFLAKAEPS